MKKIIYSLLLCGLMSMTGCQKGFLDINENPYGIKEAELSKLLTGTEQRMATYFAANGYYVNEGLPSFVHYMSRREIDNYGQTPTTTFWSNTWNNSYAGTLQNADALIVEAEAAGSKSYAAAAMLIKAYTTMCLVDLWGDIPYSEYNQPGNNTPKTDASDLIYNELLGLIDTARDYIALQSDPEKKDLISLSKDADLIFKGDLKKWVSFGNTLELRMLVQSRKAKDKITSWQTRLTDLITKNDFLTDGVDFEFPHSSTKTPSDERNTGFVSEYEGAQRGYYVSPMIHEIMNGYTQYNFPNNPLGGIVDPRIPYYFCNQMTATSTAQNDTDYRDGAFVSRFYNSGSAYNSASQDNTLTMYGIYPLGGKYDTGAGGAITSTAVATFTGAAPDKMVQAYSVPFMKAELMLSGDLAGGAAEARTQLEDGIKRSIYHVNKVSQAAKGNQSVPVIAATDASVATFINDVLAKYDSAANDDKKMEIVMTQKWIANFYNSIEAYADIRRTGYPILFNSVGGFAVSPYKHSKAPEFGPVDVPVGTLREYPRILWYPDREANTNPKVSNQGRNVVTYGNVFWDVQ